MSSSLETTFGLLEPFSFGRGYAEVIRPAAPAAGAGFTRTVPGEVLERVLTARWRVVNDGTVANRGVRVVFMDGDGNEFFRSMSPTLQTAGQTAIYSVLHTGSGNTGDAFNFNLIVVPDVLFIPGWTWRVQVQNMQAGDQIDQIALLVERFMRGADGYPLGPQVKTLESTLIEE